jgi:hypothetical protein
MRWNFAGEVFEWRGPAPWYFVETAEDADAYLHDNLGELTYGWGCIPATVRIDGHEETTALIPKDDVYLVPLKAALRRAARIDLGDTVALTLIVGDA